MRVQSIKTSFNGGEVSPLALGRVDHEKYHSWCEALQNYLPLIQGGLTRRSGTRFVCPAMGPSRLVPFKFSVVQSYTLEFGNQLLRFYIDKAQIQYSDWQATHQYSFPSKIKPLLNNPGGFSYQLISAVSGESGPTSPNPWNQAIDSEQAETGSDNVWVNIGVQPFQIATPYNTATDNLWDLKFAPFGDIVYITHPNHPPMKLNRLADNNWILLQPSFRPPPTHDFDRDIGSPNADHAAAIALSPGATTGLGITFAANAAVFIAADVGRLIVAGAGLAYITAMQGGSKNDPNTGAKLFSQVVADILDPFQSTQPIPAGSWLLRNSPQSYLMVGTIDSGGLARGTHKLGPGQQQTVLAFVNFPTNGQNAPAFEDTFRLMDLGSYIYVSGACEQILAVNTSNKVTTRQLSTITETFMNNQDEAIALPVSGGAWTLEQECFTAANGYPRAVMFCQDRLWFADTAAQPTSYWGSVGDDYENFAKGAGDDDSIDETSNNGSMEPIQWLAAYQGMFAAGTLESEYIVAAGAAVVGGNGPPITPSNFSDSQQSAFGVSPIQPVFVENDLIYLQRSLQTAYQFAFDIYRSTFGSKNLNLFNNIVTSAGFKEMVYAQVPFRTLWFTDLAGNLLSLTYNREQDVWAWARHFTGQDLWTSQATPATDSKRATMGTPPANPDQVISVTVIPDPSGLYDQVWLCTQRTINGAAAYFIEIMDLSTPLYVDAASTAVFGDPVTQVSGLAYLQGRTVQINADGSTLGNWVVPPDGTIDFTAQMQAGAKVIQVGLPFVPVALPVRPELQGAGETSQGLLKRWVKAFIRVYQTVGLQVNGREVDFRKVADEEDTGIPVAPGTNDYDVTNLGYDRDGQILISQPYPLPSTILSLFGRVSVGEN